MKVGVNGRNDFWARTFTESDYQAIRDAKVELVRMFSYADPDVYRRLRDENPAIDFIVRCMTREDRELPTSSSTGTPRVSPNCALSPTSLRFSTSRTTPLGAGGRLWKMPGPSATGTSRSQTGCVGLFPGSSRAFPACRPECCPMIRTTTWSGFRNAARRWVSRTGSAATATGLTSTPSCILALVCASPNTTRSR
jgi:hypothetical protein